MVRNDLGRAAALDREIGARIRARRRQLGLSQTELAAQLGVSFQQVQKYERGANRVAASTLVSTASALGVSVGWLVGEDAPEQGEKELVAALAEPGALELLMAFNAITDVRGRNALLAIAEELGRGDGGRQSRV